MKKEFTITEFIKKFENGDFESSDTDVQIDAGWYDWFCKDSSLAMKTQDLGKKVIQISKSKKFNPDKTYVFFKNNSLLSGKLYDSFSICDIETGNCLYWITPRDGRTGKAQVFDTRISCEIPDVEGSWNDVKNYFNN